jgi:transcriptional regulator with XRE-family HTH domain
MSQPQPVKAQLQAQGYSTAKLARRFHVNAKHLERILNGKPTPAPETRIALCEVLDAPITSLFTADVLSAAYGSEQR